MKDLKIPRFNGLNNMADPLDLGLAWLTTAKNVNITDTGKIQRRDGYGAAAVTGVDITSAYSTIDRQRLYYVDGAELKDFAGTTLRTGLASATMHWAEVNNQVYFNNGTDSGSIGPDNTVLPWRDSTLRDLSFLGADGAALDPLLYPLPLATDVIQAWGGRMYAAQYMHSQAQTVIWASMPLGYHLFRLDSDFIVVSGRVLALAPHKDSLIIGTDDAIYAYDGKSLATLASYGVVPGWCWCIDYDDTTEPVYIWTQRGMCRGLPFANLTDRHVSVAPGIQAGAAVIAQGGQKRFVASLHAGGLAFNSR